MSIPMSLGAESSITMEHPVSAMVDPRPSAPAVRMIQRVERCGPGRSELVVSTPDARIQTVGIAGEPCGAALAEELSPRWRPLAVRFELDAGRVGCTCVVTTRTGPQRVELSVPGALALVADGMHGIVTCARRT